MFHLNNSSLKITAAYWAINLLQRLFSTEPVSRISFEWIFQPGGNEANMLPMDGTSALRDPKFWILQQQKEEGNQ
jgi:hypothetical protein